MKYCTQCGAALKDGLRFCTECGGAVSNAGPSTTQATPAPPFAPVTPPAAMPNQVAVATPKRSGLKSLVLVALAVVVVVGLLGIGGLVYAGYKIKQKVSSVAEKITHSSPSPGENTPPAPAGTSPDSAQQVFGNLGKMLGVEDDNGDPVPTISGNDPVVPCSAAPFPAQGAARVPLLPGTVITTAWGMKNGDVETRLSVNSVDATSVSLSDATGVFKDDDGKSWNASDYPETVCNGDMATANTYVTVASPRMPHLIHGITRLRLSSKSFDEAKNSGNTHIRALDITYSGDGVKPYTEGGMLTRVEPQDVSYPMIVNNQLTSLPAIHLAGVVDSEGKDPRPKKERPVHVGADVYVLDDPLDPLVLMWRLKSPAYHDGNFRIEVVKLDFKVAQPVNLIEKQLTEQKRAITYGIYFDFNKDTLKPESKPVLDEIAQVLERHPDWKLSVSGHTDNIGEDAYNLDLSRRRAAAVKRELVSKYHVVPDRLTTDGFGASRPIDTNSTLEGRARNRRVELTRE